MTVEQSEQPEAASEPAASEEVQPVTRDEDVSDLMHAGGTGPVADEAVEMADRGEANAAPGAEAADVDESARLEPAELDPAAWEEAAAAAARAFAAEADALEALLDSVGRVSFRQFWDRQRALQELIRTAPAITLDDKLALQRRLRALGERAQEQRKQARQVSAGVRTGLIEAIELVAEQLEPAGDTAAINQLRSDLSVIRERIQREGTVLDRPSREAVWNLWQATNQIAWNRLNEYWARNEAMLRDILDGAEAQLAADHPRPARETIKRFHEAVAGHECSHRALRELRARANALWQRAQEVGRAKHEVYVAQAARRLHVWRQQEARLRQGRSALQREVAALEAQMQGAGTELAAALLRGQLAERQRALADLTRQETLLNERIAAAEAAITPPEEQNTPAK